MGLFEKITGLFSRDGGTPGGGGRTLAELAARLGMSPEQVRATPVAYREFTIAKRDGTLRKLAAPDAPLKGMQRLILRRLLGRLPVHESVLGFERGVSFVDHARVHCNRAVVVRIDLKDFFGSTTQERVMEFMRRIGWGREAAEQVCRLCCKDGVLPQGAPTSPRLANLVNGAMDRRLSSVAQRCGAVYSRYADDLTFSFGVDEPERVRTLLGRVRQIVAETGYKFNRHKGPRVLRRHQCQRVTGLVVNDGPPRLPRKTRRWLRAVEHRAATAVQTPSLTAAQLEGWRALRGMVERGSAGR